MHKRQSEHWTQSGSSRRIDQSSDVSRADDISVRIYCVDVHKRKCSAINQPTDFFVDGIDPHLWIHGIVGLGFFWQLLQDVQC
jgi:hypothetical protein